MKIIKLTFLISIFLTINLKAQTYYNLSAGNYSETFTAWTTPSTNSFSSVATATGTVPNPTIVTAASVNFITGTSGGIQNGNTNIQFLSTGATDNTSSVALDLNLNFTNRNAGTITFDAATVFNSTGNRAGSLKIYYSTNNTTWTELTGTNLPYTANNNTAKSANISIPLPNTLNNQPTVKLRFYYHNAGPALTTPTGSRPKISIDNLSVTSTSQGISLVASPTNLSNLDYFTNSGPSTPQSYNLSGSLLTSDITITAPTNFEISTNQTTGYNSTITITPTEPLNTTIYVRQIAGLTQNDYTGTIIHNGGGIATTPTVTVSGTVADIVLPTKLAIAYLTPTSPNINTNFSVTIQAQDNTNTPQNVTTATTVTLSLNTGTGTLSGTTLTAIIPAGSNSVTITGIKYNVAESNISITATRTAGDILTNANSAPFTVIDNTIPTEIKSITTGNWNTTTTWDCACIPNLTDNVRIKSPNIVTVTTTTTTEQGCAKIFVEVGATLNIQSTTFKMGYTIQSTSIHLTMGNPSTATTSISNPDNYLLEKPQYVLSYNRTQGKSNWVSWYLSSASIGSAPRQNDFRPDPSLPTGWYQVNNTDYTGSGFDRGHMTPSGDRTATIPDNSATFFMTNMIPQAPDNNQGPWEQLESYLRTQLSNNQEIYVISGSYGIGGTGSTGGITNTIAGGKVTVPSQTYKIAVILPVGTDDINRVTTATRVIAIIMPNTQGIRNNDWRIYRTSVDAIEAATGYNFLSNIPTAIQDTIEATTDTIPN